jgi:hypothetical protein
MRHVLNGDSVEQKTNRSAILVPKIKHTSTLSHSISKPNYGIKIPRQLKKKLTFFRKGFRMGEFASDNKKSQAKGYALHYKSLYEE